MNDDCTSATSQEHIIQRGIGGTLESDVVLCGECNNQLGTSVDSHLTETYFPIIHALRPFLPAKTSAITRSARSTASTLPLKVSGGWVTEATKVQWQYDEAGKITGVVGPAGQLEAMKNIAKLRGLNDLTFETGPITVFFPDDLIERVRTFDEHVPRAAAKCVLGCLDHFSLSSGRSSQARTPELANAREFVRNGRQVGAFRPLKCHFYDAEDLLDAIVKEHDGTFTVRVVISYSRADATLVGAFCLGRTMPFVFELSSATSGAADWSLIVSKSLRRNADTEASWKDACVLRNDDFKWRSFVAPSREAIGFGLRKFYEAIDDETGRAIAFADLNSDDEILGTLAIAADYFGRSGTGSSLLNEVIGHVLRQRYVGHEDSRTIPWDELVKESTGTWAFLSAQLTAAAARGEAIRGETRKHLLEAYRSALAESIERYGRPRCSIVLESRVVV